MSATPAVDWFKLHPKVKALAVAVVVLVLASVPASLNGTVSWNDTLIADVTATIALLITYLKSAAPAA